MKPLYVKKNGVVYRVSGTGIPSIYPAANVEYDNTVTSELQATDVQDAIDELSTRQGGVQSDWDEDDTTELSYIQNKPNLGTAAFKDVPASGDAGFTQVVLGKDTRLTYYDRNRYDASVKCSTNIVEGNIIVGLNGLYHHLNDGTVFDITYPILYAKNNMAAGAANKSNYDSLAIDITITQQMTLTQFLPVYIKGRLSGNMFNPISTTPLTQEMSQDGYHYMLLGLAGTTTNMYLFHDHRIFANNGGSFCELIGNLGTAAYKDIPLSGNASIYQVVTGNDTRLTDARPASDVSAWAKESTKPTYTASEVGAIATTVKGVANGVAELDAAGKVPSSQLPSFVDDVIEAADYDHLPITGESGKIYVTIDTNKTYRWTGSGYAEISESLALGETSSTAYRGDRGKTAYDHSQDSGRITSAVSSGLYKISATAQGHISGATAVQKSDITALGIPAQDTTYGVVSKTANGLAPQLPNETTTTKYLRQDGTWQIPPNDNTWKANSKTSEGYVASSSGQVRKYWRSDDNQNPGWAPIYESDLAWGGANFSGTFGCLDAAMIGHLGANRLFGAKAAGITVEYSRDTGSTWTDYGLTDAQKTAHFTQGYGILIGKADNTNKATANGNKYQLRITLDTQKVPVYTVLNKIVMNISTNGSASCTVTIQRAHKDTPTTYADIVTDQTISGWSGWNVINIASTQTSNYYRNLRFIFKANGGDTNYVGLNVINIKAFGGMGWTVPSTMAQWDHLYGVNELLDAYFPRAIRTAGSLIVNPSDVVGNYDEGIRINKGKGNWSTLTMGANADSITGTQAGAWSLGVNNNVLPRKLMIGQNGCSASGTYFYTNADATVTPSLQIGGDLTVNGSTNAGNACVASGTNSHAEGNGTKASNYYSHAEGDTTIASGSCAHAEGQETTASGAWSHAEGQLTMASGNCAHVEGYGTRASIINSHAEGNQTTASGSNSHSEGYGTKASGSSSHAEGQQTTASGNYSHAEGYQTSAYNGTTYYGSHAEGHITRAKGDSSHAEGLYTSAFGSGSHAEGTSTNASGNFSHTEGNSTTASNACSHAEGFRTIANGETSHAEGQYTTASNNNSVSFGHLNAAMTTGGSATNTTGTAFVIGNGTATNALKNAFSVQFNGVVKAASTITASTTADYAEYFEWADENPNNEDRVGYFVTFDNGDKIRFATSEDDYILGVTSGEPFVLGNGDCDVWNGMVLRDEFRRIIYEPAPDYIEIKDGGRIPHLDKDGNPVYYGTRPKLNPNYDPTKPYINRADRPEWCPVGMLGVLAVRDDGTCEVNGYATITDDAIATKYTGQNQNKYRVIRRNTQNVVEIVFR